MVESVSASNKTMPLNCPQKKFLWFRWIQHSWVEMKTVIYPGQYGEGHTEFTCKVCGATRTLRIAGGP